MRTFVPGELATTCKTDEQTAIIEPLEGGGELAERGLLLARSLVQTRAQVLPLRILNPNREKRVVQKGTAVGTIATVVADSIFTLSHKSEGKVEGDLPGHLHDLFDRSKANLSEDYHAQVKSCLLEFQDVFSSGEHDIGRTEVVKHQINTGDARPIKERPRRHPLCNQQEIMKQVEELQKRAIIEPSDSPWAANVVLVPKKDGSRRLCVD